MLAKGTATGGGVDGGICPPTLKSKGTSYVLVPPPTFTTIFILIDWSHLHTHQRSGAPNVSERKAKGNNLKVS